MKIEHQIKTILVVDDEAELRTALFTYLTGEGFAVVTASNGEEMLRQTKDGNIDLVLLDIGLGQESGLDLLKSSLSGSGLAVVMLTGKSDPIERVVGLELGADDYIVKPFLNRELLARIRAVLRRTSNVPDKNTTQGFAQLRCKTWTISLQSRRVSTATGETIDLTGTEFDLLAALAEHAGTAMTRDQLCAKALNRKWEPSDRSLDIHIHNLRRKLSLNRCDGAAIVSVRNVGYMLAVDQVEP